MTGSHRAATEQQRNPREASGGEPEAVRVHMLGGFRVSVGTRVIGEGEWRLKKAGSLINLTKSAAFSDRNPAFSPDGTMIAFSTNRDGNAEIYRIKADGTSPTRLTTNTAQDLEPDWGVVLP
jgi:hypothetical protein